MTTIEHTIADALACDPDEIATLPMSSVDSLDWAALLWELEDMHGIEIDDAEACRLRAGTAGEMIQWCQERVTS